MRSSPRSRPFCELRDFGNIECGGRIERHHVIAKSRTVKNRKARKASEHPDLIARVCTVHNVGKLADSPEARRELIRRRVIIHGEEHVRWLLDEHVGQHWKKDAPAYSYDGIMR